LSRVIKYPVWKEAPHTIEAPPPPPMPKDDAPPKGAAVDEEAVARRLAAVAEQEKQAKDMLAKAQAEAEKLRQEGQAAREAMLKEAEAQIQAMKEEAAAKGHAEGMEKGRTEGEEQVRQELASILNEANAKAEKTLADARQATRDYVQQAEEDIVSIAMAVVGKVLPQHFIDVPQTVLPLVREAIQKVREQKQLIVHVPPESFDMVLMARDEFRGLLTAGDATLDIHSDEALKPGDCLVETPNGTVDARLSTQIALVEQAVRDVML